MEKPLGAAAEFNFSHFCFCLRGHVQRVKDTHKNTKAKGAGSVGRSVGVATPTPVFTVN